MHSTVLEESHVACTGAAEPNTQRSAEELTMSNPDRVMTFPPVAGPELGRTDTNVGNFLKRNATKFEVKSIPFVVTSRLTVPSACSGEMQASEFSDINVAATGAESVPKLQASAPPEEKFAPVTVMTVPPWEEPDDGETAATEAGGK